MSFSAVRQTTLVFKTHSQKWCLLILENDTKIMESCFLAGLHVQILYNTIGILYVYCGFKINVHIAL